MYLDQSPPSYFMFSPPPLPSPSDLLSPISAACIHAGISHGEGCSPPLTEATVSSWWSMGEGEYVFFSSMVAYSGSSSLSDFTQRTRRLIGLYVYNLITMYKMIEMGLTSGFQAHTLLRSRDDVAHSELCLWWHCDPWHTSQLVLSMCLPRELLNDWIQLGSVTKVLRCLPTVMVQLVQSRESVRSPSDQDFI